MHNKKVKFLSILCATALVGQSMPVSAEEATINGEGTQSVTVTASISSDYTVTIPKALTLDKEGTAEYTVTASGEIEKLSTLTVTPDESFVLTAKYDSATAKVSQEKTAWSATDLMTDSEKTTTGTITVEGGLAPGEWSGTFNFEIALNEHVNEHVHEYTTTTTPATCTENGVKTLTCDCGHTETETIPASGHSYKTNGSTSGHTCDICDTSEEHVDTDTDYYCDVCSELLSGLYDENNVMTASWDELLENGTIHVADGVLTTNDSYLSNSSANTLVGKLIIDDSVTSLGDSAISYCKNLTSITIPDSVTRIGDWAFSGCSSLTSIDIPDSVTSIGSGAFTDCSGLTNIRIPDTVTSIDFGAFYDCSSLTSITIPSSVTSIGDDAFRGCSKLTSIDISDGVTSIGDNAFSGCSSLTSITIPSSVTNIEADVFRDCGAFTLNYKGTEEQWNAVTKGTNWNSDSTITMNYNYNE